MMGFMLLLRIFLWIPLCLILWVAAIIVATVWGHNKKMACQKKMLCLLICLLAVGNTYFMFLHGKHVKAPLNPVECADLYDSFADLARSGKQTAEGYYCIERETENISAIVAFGKETEIEFDSDQIGFLNRLYGQSFSENDIQIYMSALSANKEEIAGVQVFNGSYFGTLWMRKGDTALNILYWVETDKTKTSFYSYTCVPPKSEISLASLVC